MKIQAIDKNRKIYQSPVKRAGTGFDGELKEAVLLGESFRAFNEAADSLKTYYNRLEERVSSLNRELAEKSVALEENLKKTSALKRRQENILRSLPSGVVVFDRSGRAETINSRGEEITGYSQIEVAGKRAEEIFDGQIGDPSIGPPRETSFTNRDGRLFHLHLLTSPLVDDEAGFVLIFHDITGEKKLKEALERGKRLAAMGEMAAKLAHEIRNPLGGIELFASNLKKGLKHDPRKRMMAENICSGVSSLNFMVANILSFAKTEKKVTKRFLVRDAVSEALLPAWHLVDRQGVEVVRNDANDPAAFFGDKEMMKQVFLNIIINALQAMEDGGRLTISTHRDDGGRLNAIFEDTGKGIAESELKLLFEPFYSTKERGTGLGLAIVQGIVSAHNGSVRIRSEEGKGTEVRVILPAGDVEEGRVPYEQ